MAGKNNAARLCRQTANERRAIVFIRVHSWLRKLPRAWNEGTLRASAMLTVSQLSKSFAGRALFEDVSLQVNRGDRIGSVGPNGAGKSTLFTLLLGDVI
jgi:ABC-type molybdenum transport system ATPase subunit/photorepair protein PhrA